MKLLRYGPVGAEKPGLLDAEGNIRDASSLVSDWSGAALGEAELNKIKNVDLAMLPVVEGEPRIGACVGDVGKFICIGLNYADHAEETGAKVPDEPVVFMKATSAITGPFDNIIKPLNSTKLDWEVELGIVIGREAKYLSEDEAEAYIAGYCVVHDVSEREFQLERGGQWDKGKGCDSFGPIGPWLVTRDEVGDTSQLPLWLKVNDTVYQNGSTDKMVFRPAFLVSYLSQFMSLQAGDIISTGTPPGVGLGQKPPVFLNEGDVVELGVEGLGVQKQHVVNYQK
jgi:2,4-diketo-3-deoxy-L-fuconate hydrolase